MTLETGRLKLVLSTAAHLELELSDRPRLWKELGLRPPVSWPAPLNDDDSFKWSLDFARANPGSPWGFYYFALKEPAGPVVVGNGGFKGAPDSAGMVELGYSLIPDYQRRGLASEAVGAMVEFCRSRGVKTVRGETLPELTPSIRVLEKNGFSFVGEGSEPGVIRYELKLSTDYPRG